MLLVSRVSAGEECWRTCTDKLPCVTHKCEIGTHKPNNTWGSIECQLIMIGSVNDLESEKGCVKPANVPGLDDFCRDVVLGSMTSDLPQNVLTEETNSEPEPTNNSCHDNCMGPTTVASTGSGCFVAGTFFMWVLLATIKFLKRCSSKEAKSSSSMKSNSSNGDTKPSTNMARNRMLSNVSLDSGLSSSALPHNGPSTLNRNNYTPDGRSQDEAETITNATQTNAGLFKELSSIYTPPSESSSRDYQSIQGSVRNNYVTSSESGSDYKGLLLHRVVVTRGEEIYPPSSESSGSDYCTYRNRKLREDNAIYYPGSDSTYYRDYTSLAGDRDRDSELYCDVDIELTKEQVTALILRNRTGSNHETGSVKFHVRGLAIPRHRASFAGAHNSGLTNIAESEAVPGYLTPTGSEGKAETEFGNTRNSPFETKTDVRATGSGQACELKFKDESDVDHDFDYHEYAVCSDTPVETKHEYFVLEPSNAPEEDQNIKTQN